MTRGHLEDHVLRWLQADPYWSELGRRAADHLELRLPQVRLRGKAAWLGRKPGRRARPPVKHEGGYTIDMGQATRVSAWARCFLQLNRCWLVQLTKEVQKALRTLPLETRKRNRPQCFSNTALTYGVVQVMKAGYGPEHFDGGGSLLHWGLTIFGTRHVEVKANASAADKWDVLPQSAGSFYMGNMCAAWHRVRHLDCKGAGTLCGAAGNLHIAVMFRTEVFREVRARSMRVFDIVNQVVASSLANYPLHFPDLGTCLAELPMPEAVGSELATRT